MTSLGHSDSSVFLKKAVDLLSEDDCIIIRKSRKGTWYKPHSGQLYSYYKPDLKPNPIDSMLIDNGRRSRERVTAKPHSIDTNSSVKSSTVTKVKKCPNKHSKECKIRPSSDLKDSQSGLSSDAMAYMLKLAINDKCKPLMDNMCNQLKFMNQKSKNSVLNKLDLSDRLTVIKSIYSIGSNNSKSSAATQRDFFSPRSRLSNYRLSSSLSRIDEKLIPFRRPVRKSFSFLQKDLPLSEKPKINHKEKESSNITVQQPVSVLIKQIEVLQNQNSELSKTVRDLISKNFVLERKLERLDGNELRIYELKAKMENLTQCHDDIITNVYKAYRQLTKNLQQLKSHHPRSMSSTNLTSYGIEQDKHNKPHRSHSLDTFRKNEQHVNSTGQTSPSINPLRNGISNISLDTFLSRRKLELHNELNIANDKLQKIDRLILTDLVDSAMHKKHLLEKNFLQQHQSTLKTMLKAME